MFSLAGFGSVQREGIDITANFTATVNAEMRVGTVTETVTVSGASPVVDVQNVIQQAVMQRQVIEIVPTGKYFNNYAALIPGMNSYSNTVNTTQDVGGTLGSFAGFMTIHGSHWNDQQYKVDGMSTNSLLASGTGHYIPTDSIVEEFNFLTGSKPAESETGGLQVNMVPREGGNAYRGIIFVSAANEHTQANNIDDELRRAGLQSSNELVRQYDFSPSLGGPISRDKLWFYAGGRYYPNDRLAGGILENKDPKAWIYEPDPSRPGIKDTLTEDYSVRFTWQATAKHKLSAFYNYNHICDCHRGVAQTVSPEASSYTNFYNHITQYAWTNPVTNKLLLDAGATFYWWLAPRPPRPEATEVGILEQSNNLRYRNLLVGGTADPGHNFNYRAAISYVSGSHSLKFGFTGAWFWLKNVSNSPPGDISYRVLNGVPNQVTYYATPYQFSQYVTPIGFFAQDQWTFKRLTLNPGLRFDWVRNGYDPVALPATRWMVARSFDGAQVANLKDLSPRLSASYDLSGNARTALKVSLSRYVVQLGGPFVNPVSASNNTSSRTWNDLNGDHVVQGDPFSLTANGELGPQTNVNFGRTVFTQRSDPDYDRGFGKREYNWETSAGVQHELMPNLSVSGTYFRRWFGNFFVLDNRAVEVSDFTRYCFNTPRDSRLPGGGGDQVCNFDVNPNKLGQFDILKTAAEPYGDQSRMWQGFDATMNARLPNGVSLQGGLSSGREIDDACEIANAYPDAKVFVQKNLDDRAGSTASRVTRAPQFCRTEQPWLTQVKFLGSMPLPWGMQFGASMQNTHGSPVNANFVATNALIAPSLGRNLAAGANSSVTLNIIDPETMFLPRFTQVDLRVNKTFRFGRASIRPAIDAYNVFNVNEVMEANSTYGTNGAAWLRPSVVLSGRIIRFSAQVNY